MPSLPTQHTAQLHRLTGSPLGHDQQQQSTRAGRAPAPHGVAAATGDNRPRVQSERRDEVAAREALPPLSDRLVGLRRIFRSTQAQLVNCQPITPHLPCSSYFTARTFDHGPGRAGTRVPFPAFSRSPSPSSLPPLRSSVHTSGGVLAFSLPQSTAPASPRERRLVFF